LSANAQEVDDVVVVADPLHDLHLVDLKMRVKILFSSKLFFILCDL
jgi:hypothetical protein